MKCQRPLLSLPSTPCSLKARVSRKTISKQITVLTLHLGSCLAVQDACHSSGKRSTRGWLSLGTGRALQRCARRRKEEPVNTHWVCAWQIAWPQTFLMSSIFGVCFFFCCWCLTLWRLTFPLLKRFAGFKYPHLNYHSLNHKSKPHFVYSITRSLVFEIRWEMTPQCLFDGNLQQQHWYGFIRTIPGLNFGSRCPSKLWILLVHRAPYFSSMNYKLTHKTHKAWNCWRRGWHMLYIRLRCTGI